MAALKEARSYGLSCGRVSDGSKVSVFHVKLTDSALRAFESYRASQVSGAVPGATVGDVEAQAGLMRPSRRRPVLGARGPVSGVLLAGPWTDRSRGDHLSGLKRGEPRSLTALGGDTGRRPGAAKGPRASASGPRWGGGAVFATESAPGGVRSLPGSPSL